MESFNGSSAVINDNKCGGKMTLKFSFTEYYSDWLGGGKVYNKVYQCEKCKNLINRQS